MAVSKKHQEYANEYIKNNYDRINIVVPKGEREQLKEHAASMGESLNAFVARATDEQIKRDHAHEFDLSFYVSGETLSKMKAIMDEHPEVEWDKEVHTSIFVNDTISPEMFELFTKVIDEHIDLDTAIKEIKASKPLEQGPEAEEGEV